MPLSKDEKSIIENWSYAVQNETWTKKLTMKPCERMDRQFHVEIISHNHAYCVACQHHIYLTTDANDFKSYFVFHMNNPLHIQKKKNFQGQVLFDKGNCKACKTEVSETALPPAKGNNIMDLIEKHLKTVQHTRFNDVYIDGNNSILMGISKTPPFQKMFHHFNCKVCDKQMSSTVPHQEHLGSKSHLNKFHSYLIEKYDYVIGDKPSLKKLFAAVVKTGDFVVQNIRVKQSKQESCNDPNEEPEASFNGDEYLSDEDLDKDCVEQDYDPFDFLNSSRIPSMIINEQFGGSQVLGSGLLALQQEKMNSAVKVDNGEVNPNSNLITTKVVDNQETTLCESVEQDLANNKHNAEKSGNIDKTEKSENDLVVATQPIPLESLDEAVPESPQAGTAVQNSEPKAATTDFEVPVIIEAASNHQSEPTVNDSVKKKKETNKPNNLSKIRPIKENVYKLLRQPHPAEMVDRQPMSFKRDDSYMDLINPYHAYCYACSQHIYSYSDRFDVCSYLENHVNSSQHQQRFLPLSVEMFVLDEANTLGENTWRCNGCEIHVQLEEKLENSTLRHLVEKHLSGITHARNRQKAEAKEQPLKEVTVVALESIKSLGSKNKQTNGPLSPPDENLKTKKTDLPLVPIERKFIPKTEISFFSEIPEQKIRFCRIFLFGLYNKFETVRQYLLQPPLTTLSTWFSPDGNPWKKSPETALCISCYVSIPHQDIMRHVTLDEHLKEFAELTAWRGRKLKFLNETDHFKSLQQKAMSSSSSASATYCVPCDVLYWENSDHPLKKHYHEMELYINRGLNVEFYNLDDVQEQKKLWCNMYRVKMTKKPF